MFFSVFRLSMKLSDFEKKVVEGFSLAEKVCESLFVNPILFAVSGGADSVAMLVACVNICKHFFCGDISKIFVVTVNHNIREADESARDAEFVKKLCKFLNVECFVVEFPRGKVLFESKKRGKGIEEAARYLRYKAFDEIAKKINSDIICLAHNKNDQLETLLQRFFQGSGGVAAAGIRNVRKNICRPLLNISRTEILQYLSDCNIDYQTDYTNEDNKYFRNKIRNMLIPFLNENIVGWDTGILSGAEKQKVDSEYIDLVANTFKWNCSEKDIVTMSCDTFFSQHESIKRRLLLKAFELLGVETRIPFKFVREVTNWNIKDKREVCSICSGIQIFCDEKNIKISLNTAKKKENSKYGFSILIDKCGEYETDFGIIKVKDLDAPYNLCDKKLGKACLPFVVRSCLPGDKIKHNDASFYCVIEDLFYGTKVYNLLENNNFEIANVQNADGKEKMIFVEILSEDLQKL